MKHCWQCVSIGTWHSRPILSGSFCMDGSVLALGFQGYVVLWEPEKATELQALPIGDDVEQVSQLSFAIACGRFVLVANSKVVKSKGDGIERITCWDLVSLEMFAQLNLTNAVPGTGRCAFRIQEAIDDDTLNLLTFREEFYK